MKKYMVADLIKAVEDERDQEIIDHMSEHGGISYDESKYLLDNWDNEADHDQVILCAESLGLGITDIEDDDIENYMEMGGNKGKIESSSGIIQWIYDNTLKAYIVLLMVEENALMYLIDNDMMKEWINSDSAGEYYNENIRSNEQIESQGEPYGVPCGCGPNPCEQGKIDQFNNKYSSIL
jgi:polyhydroxyalkanoate synthesis regulator phasin